MKPSEGVKENYLLGPPNQMIIEREYYVSLILPKEQLIKRWNEINYTPPKNKQLKMFLE